MAEGGFDMEMDPIGEREEIEDFEDVIAETNFDGTEETGFYDFYSPELKGGDELREKMTVEKVISDIGNKLNKKMNTRNNRTLYNNMTVKKR